MGLDLGAWYMVPGKPHLARLYCDSCESSSRAVRVPTQAEKDAATERAGRFIPMYPDPPKGWDNGCPRCDR